LQEYIDQHSLQKVVEDVLNGCVKSKPDEPLTFMVRAEHSSPDLSGTPAASGDSSVATAHDSA
jgi:hypothetical protein